MILLSSTGLTITCTTTKFWTTLSIRLLSELTPPTTNDLRTKGSPDKERESDKRIYPCITTSKKDRRHCIFYCKDN